jgi:hypothetical protein
MPSTLGGISDLKLIVISAFARQAALMIKIQK